MPWSWRWFILANAGINSAVTIFWERIVVKYATIKWKIYKENKENARLLAAGEDIPIRRRSSAARRLSRGRRQSQGRKSNARKSQNLG